MRLQSSLLTAVLLAAGATSLPAQSMLRASPSTRATIEVELAFPRDSTPAGAQPTSIRIDYGQPHLRGRSINTDGLVPWDTPWRTGANAATTLITGADLVIGGQAVPRGTYELWTLPSRTGWKLIIQKSNTPGTVQPTRPYDATRDFVRIDLRTRTLPEPLESLTMWLIPALAPNATRGELRIAWGTTMLSTDWSVR